MKIFYKEFDHVDYSTYRFPYCVYCLEEAGDQYFEIYEKGFLPYTNDLTIEDSIFYLARSVRVNLTENIWNYKQKNIINKFADVFPADKIDIKLQPKETFITDPVFRKWCIDNAAHNFLHEERLDYILSRPYLKDILTITCDGKLLDHIFLVHDVNEFVHVWYSFYDLGVELNDFGKFVFLKAMEWAKNHNYKHFYMGTCYAKSAIYKLQLSRTTRFFDGEKWNDDVSDLKRKLLTETK